MTVFNHTLRILLALVFLVAGTIKLVDMSAFTESVGDFGLVPDWFVPHTAWLVVGAELIVGLCLALNLRGSLAAVFVLLAVFLGVLSYGIALGLDIQCGCFGPGIHVSLQTQSLVDIGLVLLASAVYWSSSSCRTQKKIVATDNGKVD